MSAPVPSLFGANPVFADSIQPFGSGFGTSCFRPRSCFGSGICKGECRSLEQVPLSALAPVSASTAVPTPAPAFAWGLTFAPASAPVHVGVPAAASAPVPASAPSRAGRSISHDNVRQKLDALKQGVEELRTMIETRGVGRLEEIPDEADWPVSRVFGKRGRSRTGREMRDDLIDAAFDDFSKIDILLHGVQTKVKSAARHNDQIRESSRAGRATPTSSAPKVCPGAPVRTQAIRLGFVSPIPFQLPEGTEDEPTAKRPRQK